MANSALVKQVRLGICRLHRNDRLKTPVAVAEVGKNFKVKKKLVLDFQKWTVSDVHQ